MSLAISTPALVLLTSAYKYPHAISPTPSRALRAWRDINILLNGRCYIYGKSLANIDRCQYPCHAHAIVVVISSMFFNSCNDIGIQLQTVWSKVRIFPWAACLSAVTSLWIIELFCLVVEDSFNTDQWRDQQVQRIISYYQVEGLNDKTLLSIYWRPYLPNQCIKRMQKSSVVWRHNLCTTTGYMIRRNGSWIYS